MSAPLLGRFIGTLTGPTVALIRMAPDAVAAGFPSPAQDYFDGRIDLNQHLIRDVTSTFIVRVSGQSMVGAGISHGDEIIVDRSLTPVDGSVVVAVLDGELTIKRSRDRTPLQLQKRRPSRASFSFHEATPYNTELFSELCSQQATPTCCTSN